MSLIGSAYSCRTSSFAAALGLADFDPVGGLIASAAETRDLTESLEQYRADGVPLPASPSGRRRWQQARICEARFGMRIHGRIRKRALFATRCRLRCRTSGDQPMKRSRGAVFQAAAPNPSSASGCPADAADEVSNLRSGQRTVTEIMIAFHERIPDRRARSGLDHLELQRLNLVAGPRATRVRTAANRSAAGRFWAGAEDWPNWRRWPAAAVRSSHDDASAAAPPRALMLLEAAVGLAPVQISH